jgi:hypothetical protein
MSLSEENKLLLQREKVGMRGNIILDLYSPHPNPLGNCFSIIAPALFYLRASCPNALLYLPTSI